jgi:nitrate reductase molybdenum cofactor assembly chaperone NarJ/NarW
VNALAAMDGESAGLLSRFLAHEPATEEEYIDLFELSPQCALYLGSHGFEEPKTCSGAANCDRNKYMVEVVNLYRHFGLALDSTELPDYLPLMVEFLALTAGSSDDVRRKLIGEYMLPFLEPMCSQLDKLETPYVDLCRALDAILRADLGQVEDTSNEAEVVHG